MILSSRPIRAIYLLGFATVCAVTLTAIYRTDFVTFALIGNQVLKGRVMSQVGEPIHNAHVAVESGYFDAPGSPGPIIVRTNKDGTFEVGRRSHYYRLTAWKEGYAADGCNPEMCVGDSNLRIELRRVETKQTVPTVDEIYDLSAKSAFSFRRGEAVDRESPDADIIINVDPVSPWDMTISVPPGGGIAGAEVPGTIDFDAVPVAPEIYEDSVKADRYFYFVKTPNGKYAKFRIMPDHAVDSNGRKYLGLSSCRLIWGFQSDGSRNLETVSASEPPVLFQGSL